MRREWQQCRKEKNEEEFSSTENTWATSEKTERHRFVTNTGYFEVGTTKYHSVLS